MSEYLFQMSIGAFPLTVPQRPAEASGEAASTNVANEASSGAPTFADLLSTLTGAKPGRATNAPSVGQQEADTPAPDATPEGAPTVLIPPTLIPQSTTLNGTAPLTIDASAPTDALGASDAPSSISPAQSDVQAALTSAEPDNATATNLAPPVSDTDVQVEIKSTHSLSAPPASSVPATDAATSNLSAVPSTEPPVQTVATDSAQRISTAEPDASEAPPLAQASDSKPAPQNSAQETAPSPIVSGQPALVATVVATQTLPVTDTSGRTTSKAPPAPSSVLTSEAVDPAQAGPEDAGVEGAGDLTNDDFDFSGDTGKQSASNTPKHSAASSDAIPTPAAASATSQNSAASGPTTQSQSLAIPTNTTPDAAAPPPAPVNLASTSTPPTLDSASSTQMAGRPADASGLRWGDASSPAAIQVQAKFIERFNGRAQQFDIRLDPAELGRVNIRIEIGADNRVHAILAAHDPNTLNDLMRGQRALEQSLADAGIDLSDEGLQFELSDNPNDTPSDARRDTPFRGDVRFASLDTPLDDTLRPVGSYRFDGRINLVA